MPPLKRCPRCKTEKILDEFYKNCKTSDGLTCWCKVCTKIDQAYYRKLENPIARRASDRNCYNNNKEHYKLKRKLWGKETGYEYPRDRQKLRAKSAVRYAVKTGRLTKLPCKICGDSNVHAHHEDYNRKLDVIWLCPKHHGLTWRKDAAT